MPDEHGNETEQERQEREQRETEAEAQKQRDDEQTAADDKAKQAEWEREHPAGQPAGQIPASAGSSTAFGYQGEPRPFMKALARSVVECVLVAFKGTLNRNDANFQEACTRVEMALANSAGQMPGGLGWKEPEAGKPAKPAESEPAKPEPEPGAYSSDFVKERKI